MLQLEPDVSLAGNEGDVKGLTVGFVVEDYGYRAVIGLADGQIYALLSVQVSGNQLFLAVYYPCAVGLGGYLISVGWLDVANTVQVFLRIVSDLCQSGLLGRLNKHLSIPYEYLGALEIGLLFIDRDVVIGTYYYAVLLLLEVALGVSVHV